MSKNSSTSSPYVLYLTPITFILLNHSLIFNKEFIRIQFILIEMKTNTPLRNSIFL